jgi:carbon-monoxide dehydrogenase catalytic subunit
MGGNWTGSGEFSCRPERVLIPGTPVSQVSGFSMEVIEQALGGTWEPLLNAIKAGQIRGAVGVVGCNNPKVVQDYGHTTLTRKLIDMTSWWWTPAAPQAHAKGSPEAAELAAWA